MNRTLEHEYEYELSEEIFDDATNSLQSETLGSNI